MVDNDPKIFKATDRSREIFREICDQIHGPGLDRFFELWEQQGSPREAGSVIAEAFTRTAAIIAAFGAICEGREPNLELWTEMTRAQFHEAIKVVAEATAVVEPEIES